MQINNMWHHRRAQHGHSNVNTMAVNHGNSRVKGDLFPVQMDEKQFDHVAGADHEHECHDRDLEASESPQLKREDEKNAYGGG